MNDSLVAPDALIAGVLAEYAADPTAVSWDALLESLATASWASWEQVVTQVQAASPPATLAFLDAAHTRWPLRSDLAFLLGNHLRVRGDAARAEQVFRAAMREQPQDINPGLSLSYLLRELGRLNAANEALIETWRNGPRGRSGDLGTLQLLCENHGQVIAASIVDEILRANPNDAALLALAGEIHLTLGHFQQAATHLREALQLWPASAASWLRLSQTHRFQSADDPDLRLMELAANETALPADARHAVGFALAKARSDLGDIEAAVKSLRSANRGERERLGWSREAWSQFALAEAQAPAMLPSGLQLPFTPVFIVGMPRSGTTLAATLLSRRADVRNRGELNWIAAIAGKLGPAPDRAALRQAAEMIATHLRRDDADALCYIDKNPLNFRHLRLIAALFPTAKIIHCQRDSRDTALSIWSQHFAHPDLAWTYDFSDIAAYEAGYRQLMATAPRLALPTFDLRYEQLVEDSDAVLARLHAFLGLPTQSTAEADDQTIVTASVWQARQPVHRESVQRWKQWAAHLPELSSNIPN